MLYTAVNTKPYNIEKMTGHKIGQINDMSKTKQTNYAAKVIVENGNAIKDFCDQLNKIPEFQILTPEQKMHIASCYPIIISIVTL